MSRYDQDDEERPRWRDADEDEDEPREWEIEPEEEKEDRQPVLSGTASLARLVFAALLLLIVLGGVIAFIKIVGREF